MTQPTPETDAYYGVLPNSDAQVRGRKPERDFARTLERQRDEAVELVKAFKSYLEDDSRSPRRKQACLNACSAFLERMKDKT